MFQLTDIQFSKYFTLPTTIPYLSLWLLLLFMSYYCIDGIILVYTHNRFTTYFSVVVGAIYTASLFYLAYDVNKNDAFSRQYLTIHHCESVMIDVSIAATFCPTLS